MGQGDLVFGFDFGFHSLGMFLKITDFFFEDICYRGVFCFQIPYTCDDFFSLSIVLFVVCGACAFLLSNGFGAR